MKTLKYLCLISILTFSTVASAENKLTLDQLLGLVSGQYIDYCGNNTKKRFENGNWHSHKQCLKDGRIHLVYANTKNGGHGKYPLKRNGEDVIEFSSEDKDILLDAIYEGAQIFVGEAKHINQCVEASIHKDHPNEGVCSTTARIYADWSIEPPFNTIKDKKRHHPNAADAEFNRYLTSGYREFNLLRLNDHFFKSPRKPANNASEEEKKKYETTLYKRSRIASYNAIRWYIRY